MRWYGVLAFLLTFACSAEAGVIIQNLSGSGGGGGGGGGSLTFDSTSSATTSLGDPLDWSHTVADQSDTLLIVAIGMRTNNGQSVSSITYNGVLMTSTVTIADNGSRTLTEIHYLVNPATGTNTVSVDLSENAGISGMAISYYGAHQTTPITGSASSGNSVDTSAMSDTVSSATGEVCLDALTLAQNLSVSADSGQTERVNITANGDNRLGVSTEPGSASVTMGWTWTPDEWASHGMVCFQPSS